jgi:hypothetical protein
MLPTVLFLIAILFYISFLLLGVFSYFRRCDLSLTESFPYAVIVVFSLFSLSLYLVFLLKIPRFYIIFDLIFLCCAASLVYAHRRTLGETFLRLKDFLSQNPAFSLFFLVYFSYLFLRGVLIPPTTYDSMTYHLARIMMIQSEGQLFLDNFANYRQDFLTIGYDILYYLFLRFSLPIGLTVYNFLCYIAIISGLYALVNKLYCNIKLNKSLSIIAASLPVFYYQSFSTKNDLVLATLTIVFLLAAYNYLITKRLIHLYILILTVCYGILAKLTFILFLMSFLFLYIFLLYKKEGFFKRQLEAILSLNLKSFIPLIILLGLLFFLGLHLHNNYQMYGHPSGPVKFLPLFAWIDGFRGAALNLCRYFVHIINFPAEIFGTHMTRWHDQILGAQKLVGMGFPILNMPYRLENPFLANDCGAWYGPLGLLLFCALIYSAIRDKGFIRMVALSGLVEAILIIVYISYSPYTGRYFAPTMTCGLVCLGQLFHRALVAKPRAGRWLICLTVIISLGNLTLMTIFNNNRLHLRKYCSIIKKSGFLNYPRYNKELLLSYYSGFYDKGFLKNFVEKIPSDSKVLVVTGTSAPVFPLLILRPDLSLTITGEYYAGFPKTLKVGKKEYDLSKKKDCDAAASLFDNVLIIQTTAASSCLENKSWKSSRDFYDPN